MPTESFIVDAAILQELGEQLIGRPAIALGELVKNAYDADATVCRIEFRANMIVVSDNGDGMTDDDFAKHWMRIATTHKVDERTSSNFKRPLTGSKGIGRLSAQFLANELVLDSTSRKHRKRGVHAALDWRTAVRGTDLSKVTVTWGSESYAESYADGSKFGTRIELKGLKTIWDASTLEELGNDIWMLRSPFKQPSRRPTTSKRDEFRVDIEAPNIAAAHEAFDRTIKAVFSNWKARIRGNLDNGRAGGKAVVKVEFRKGYPTAHDTAKEFQTTVPVPVRATTQTTPSLIDRAEFEILIFKTVGRQPGGVSVTDLREYLGRFGNVSMYDASFRLPYYGSKAYRVGEDWLNIAADQSRRLNQSDLLPENLQMQNRYMLDLPATGRTFGAVEIDTNHERWVARRSPKSKAIHLELQPGRDRLHDNTAFYQLRDLVRFSIDYYANRYRARHLESLESQRPSEPSSTRLERAVEVFEESKRDISPSVYRIVKRELDDAVRARRTEEELADERAALLAPLASAGMTALALNHEISRESAFLRRIGRRLRELAKKHALVELADLAKEFDEGKDRLDSLRELFAPLLSGEDKLATDRLRVHAVIKQTVKGMSVLMPGVRINLDQVPADLRFPVGSLAEWSALLQNILSNAWNALLDSTKREILFTGGRDGRGREWLHMSDTGQGLGVPLSESDRLFAPFERALRLSQDKRSIAIGGQGLGLAIVRMLARRRLADVRFVEPIAGFSTTFEVSWRGAKK
jgi:signal transduction histidine kinase